MTDSLRSSAQKVQAALQERGFSFQVTELPESTRTAEDAAAAIGCTVPQIAKSLIFRGAESGAPILAIAGGANRVSLSKLSDHAGEPVDGADADFVREHTGFAIGGVPPVGHNAPIPTFIDEDLLEHDVLWAAAGTPNAVFKLDASALANLTGGQVCNIKE